MSAIALIAYSPNTAKVSRFLFPVRLLCRNVRRSRETGVCLETGSRARGPSASQPANRPTGWPAEPRRSSLEVSSSTKCKSSVPFRIRELRRNRVCHFICRSVAAECVTASKVSGRYESAATSQPTRWDNRVPLPHPNGGHYAITCLGSPYTPRYRSLSVIDERHFCNDSPTCDFSILKGGEGSTGERARTVRSKAFKRRYVVYVKSIIVLSSSMMREHLGKYCNDDEMTLHIAYLLMLQYRFII